MSSGFLYSHFWHIRKSLNSILDCYPNQKRGNKKKNKKKFVLCQNLLAMLDFPFILPEANCWFSYDHCKFRYLKQLVQTSPQRLIPIRFVWQGNLIGRGVLEFCDGGPPVRSGGCFFFFSFLHRFSIGYMMGDTFLKKPCLRLWNENFLVFQMLNNR